MTTDIINSLQSSYVSITGPGFRIYVKKEDAEEQKKVVMEGFPKNLDDIAIVEIQKEDFTVPLCLLAPGIYAHMSTSWDEVFNHSK